ncbi:hypothetical protein Tco_1112105, partial [Tanacetum coccineum]
MSSSPYSSDSDIENTFSSTNILNYFPASPRNASPESSDDFTKYLLDILVFSPLHDDLKTYVRRFQELAVLCPNMVPNSKKLMEAFIGGLPQCIEGNVTASKYQTLEEVVNIPQRLMDQILKRNSVQETYDHKRKFEDKRNTNTDNNNYPNNRNNNKYPNDQTTATMIITNNKMEGRKPSRLMETVDIMDLIPSVGSVHCIT